jgi:hypothetical protein
MNFTAWAQLFKKFRFTTSDLAKQSPKPEVKLAKSQALQSLVEET